MDNATREDKINSKKSFTSTNIVFVTLSEERIFCFRLLVFIKESEPTIFHLMSNAIFLYNFNESKP